MTGRSILDEYVRALPTGEAAINIFKGEWSSKLPPPFSDCTGTSTLFEDGRITWIEQALGGLNGYSVLELGPLEGGHTSMMERAGAATIVSIEANTRSYLKCLIVKELLKLKRVTFLCGDFVEYLRASPPTFDLCVASGVLYHLQDPMEALVLMGNVSDRIALWTHYFDDAVIAQRPELASKFGSPEPRSAGDVEYVAHRYQYGAALDWQGFCGGSAPDSIWLPRDAILEQLTTLGFNQIDIAFDDKRHQNGPAFAILAQRS